MNIFVYHSPMKTWVHETKQKRLFDDKDPNNFGR